MMTKVASRQEKMTTDDPVVNAIVLSLLTLSPTFAKADEPLIGSISKETLWRNRDGKGHTWFHPCL